jgi:hypothetical protein
MTFQVVMDFVELKFLYFFVSLCVIRELIIPNTAFSERRNPVIVFTMRGI